MYIYIYVCVYLREVRPIVSALGAVVAVVSYVALEMHLSVAILVSHGSELSPSWCGRILFFG